VVSSVAPQAQKKGGQLSLAALSVVASNRAYCWPAVVVVGALLKLNVNAVNCISSNV